MSNKSGVTPLDSNGFIKSIENPAGEAHQIENDSSGYLKKFTLPGGGQSTVTYSDGVLVSKDEGAGGDFISLLRTLDTQTGIQTVAASTAMGRKTLYTTSATSSSSSHTVVDPSGSSSSSSNAARGDNVSVDGRGVEYRSTMAEDPRYGWMAPYQSISSYKIPNSNIDISVQKSIEIKYYELDGHSRFESLTSSAVLQNDPSRTFKSIYNFPNRMMTSTSPLNRVMKTSLNEYGQIQQMQVGNIAPTAFNYDERGRISSIQQGDRNSSIQYDAQGNVAASTNSLGQKTMYEFDASGRLRKEIRPDGRFVAMTYDSNGNMTSITPPGRSAHSFVYNLFEFVSEYLPPAINSQIFGATTYSYNLDKQITKIEKSDGSQVLYNYDGVSGLLQSVGTPSGNFDLSYVSQSNLVSAIRSPDLQKLEFQYVGSLPSSVKYSGPVNGGLSYLRRADGAIDKIGVAGVSGVTSYLSLAYDKDGLVVGIGNEQLLRDGNGAVSTSKLGNILESRSYDGYGQLVSDQFWVKKSSLYYQKFGRDKLGRIVSASGSHHKDGKFYKYDSLGRLEEVGNKGKVVRRYKYDENGNRISVSTRKGTVVASYDSQDRLIRYGDTTYEYDQSGNLSVKIEREKHGSHKHGYKKSKEEFKKTFYSYDIFGNLKSVVLSSGKRIDYIIDGQNRRVGKKVNGNLVQGFIYQSQTQIAAELDGAGNVVKRFVYGTKANVPDYMIYKGKDYRIISDQVGTPQVVVDSEKGKEVASFDFDEFGVQEAEGDGHGRGHGCREKGMEIPFGFAGGLSDEDTGLVRFGARDYDAEVGRWTSKDPIGFAGGDANLYGYVLNDSVNFIDPSGLVLVFGDSTSRRIFNALLNNRNLSAANRVLIDRLQQSTAIINISQGINANRPEGLVLGRTIGYKDNNNSNVELWIGSAGDFGQSVLLHELVHAGQIMDGLPVLEEPAYEVSNEFLKKCSSSPK